MLVAPKIVLNIEILKFKQINIDKEIDNFFNFKNRTYMALQNCS